MSTTVTPQEIQPRPIDTEAISRVGASLIEVVDAFRRLCSAFVGAAEVVRSFNREYHSSLTLITLNELESTVRAAGITPTWHRDPEQDLWRQMDQIRLKLTGGKS